MPKSPPPTTATATDRQPRAPQGYGCTPEACDNPTVMELWAVNDKGAAQPDTPLWKSQPLNQHSGDQGHWKEEAYSPAVAVSAECGECVGQYLDFKWLNNGHNVQILLPITVSIDVVPWGAPTPPFGPAARPAFFSGLLKTRGCCVGAQGFRRWRWLRCLRRAMSGAG